MSNTIRRKNKMSLKVKAELDKNFQPMALVYRDFLASVEKAGAKDIAISVFRNNGYVFTFETKIYAEGHEEENYSFIERLAKTLLWCYGGYRLVISGDMKIADRLKAAYSPGGKRDFDRGFMSRVYERPFDVAGIEKFEDAPKTHESSSPVGRHLDGCRIGFDAGGSDRKVSAVIDGKPVFSEEVVWFPKTKTDPEYHYEEIKSAMKTAAAHMPRVDAIGVSTAGVCIDNRIMVSSLFIKVPDELFDRHVKNIYLDVAKELGNVPIEVANDGDVTALAGSMSLDKNNVFGVAMGTSEAVGYVDKHGNITGRLNELAFVPVDFYRGAAVDEWSGDYGCGVKYLSQDGVIKLAPAAGIELDASLSPAEKLKTVQELMEKDDSRARKIFETIGVYFGYSIAYYSNFYDIDHVLILGRVTSGRGGTIILDKANEVLRAEFPHLAEKILLHIPDEKSRRVGQSVAAASLTQIK
jgi:predicted NBD/HSP70 family sugar kinase